MILFNSMSKKIATHSWFAVFLLIGILLVSCNSEKSSEEEELPKDSLAKEETAISQEKGNPEAQIEKILRDYYLALEEEDPDITDFYAPVVEKFYSADSFMRSKVGESLERSFDRVENRKVEVDWESLEVQKDGNTYVATFEGSTTYNEAKNSQQVESHFANQLTFDQDLRIVKYEDAATARQAQQTVRSMERVEARDLYQPLLVIMNNLRKGNLSKLTPFIHPTFGTYLITQPGAISIPYQCTQIEELKKHAYWLEEGDPTMCRLPQVAPLPTFTCAEQFSKEGCFFDALSDPYSGLSTLMKSLEEAEITRYQEAPFQEVKKVEALISHQMIDTSSHLSLYFGKIDASWYLLIIDLATYDCSA